MKYFHLIISYFFLHAISFSIHCHGQSINTFNLNTDNNLSSNRIYGFITDRYGYLWVCTEKGVVKYNGYDCRLFNLSDGLPTNDVWQVLEDRNGKIWLGNISDEIGYIYNNKYHKAYLNGVTGTMYPKGLSRIKDGIMFASPHVNGDNTFTFCVENNDTVGRVRITDAIFDKATRDENKTGIHIVYMNCRDENGPLLLYNNSVYEFLPQFKTTKVKKLFKLSGNMTVSELVENSVFVSGKYFFLFYMDVKRNSFIIISTDSGKKEIVTMPELGLSENIQYMHSSCNSKDVFIITDRHILQVDNRNGIKLTKTYAINDMIPDKSIDGSKVRAFYNDSLWGNCIGTTTNGLWINTDICNRFIPERNIDLHNYKYIGSTQDSTCIWWNQITSTMARIEQSSRVTYYHHNTITNIKNILPYHGDTFLMAGPKPYLFINKTNNIIPLNWPYFYNTTSAIKQDDTSYITISLSGFNKVKMAGANSAIQVLNAKRYETLIYDSLRKNYWAYNNDNIFIHGAQKNVLISKEQLSSFGVQKIEKILIDNKYGNIIIKGYNNVTLYDYNKNSFIELFSNINLSEASIHLYHNTLIVTGRFGILFSKILGVNSVSAPVKYLNIKNINYNYIYDCQLSAGKALLNTDKGTYSIRIPDDSAILNAKEISGHNYKFIVNYRDSQFTSKPNDTININQKDLKLQFDIINPLGNGKIKFVYTLSNDSVWHSLNSNELNLPQLHAGHYYTLYIVASDNVWKSDRIALHVFIKPYWWQTYYGKRIVWASVVFMLLLLIITSVVITRKLVLKTTKQRQLRMELELKAIYAQINPHFIFNSLNSALLLVRRNKMPEAYNHISKFSRLLRSYIKSSRNKFITISEEVSNLTDYVELQQMRFKNKFEYSFIVDDALSPGSIQIPSLLLQPFVENAINHGILQMQGAGQLNIIFRQSDEKNELICIIEDNGIGRKQSKLIKDGQINKDASFGDLLIKDLVSIFNEYEHMNIEITYTDKEVPHTGTIVTIKIKNPHHAT